MGYLGNQITTVFPTSISVDSATISDDITVDTSTLKVDSTNNRVGIGTASPEENLEVSHATAPAIQLNRTNDGGFKSILRQQGNDFEIRGSSGSTKIYTGNADGDSSTARLIIDANGHVTMPSQSAFRAHKASGVSQFNIGSSATTVTFGGEIFDTNSDYDATTDTFTAPVDGTYLLHYALRLQSIDSASSYYNINLSTSNRGYNSIFSNDRWSADLTYWTPMRTVIADMDAGDTAHVEILFNGGTAQTDISGSSNYTVFSGCLIG